MDKQPLSELRLKDVQKILEDISKRDAFYYGDLEQIAKMFLGETLSINVWSSPFDEIRNATIAESDTPGLPADKEKFYKEICDIYCWLKEEPRIYFLQYYSTAQRHLDEIDDRIRRIETELAAIEREKAAKKYHVGEVDRQAVLSYYLFRNEEAKEEIFDFLRTKLKSLARYKAMNGIAGTNLFFGFSYTYALKGVRDFYEPKDPTDIDNKFLDELVGRREEIKKLYEEKPQEFNEYLKEFINREEIVFLIKQEVAAHHLLVERSEIIHELLNQYEQGAYSTFLNVAVSQIEGILTECYLLFETDIKTRDALAYEISSKGLGWKLEGLKMKYRLEFHYEYYNFRFRVLRNKIAHGRLTVVDKEKLAGILLLDIYDVCKLVDSLRILVNRKVVVVRILHDEIKKGKIDFWFLLCYVLLNDIEVPPFYGLERAITEIEILKDKNEFWEYLSSDKNLSNDTMKAGIYHAALRMVKDKDIGIKKKSETLLKQLAFKPNDEFDRVSFFDSRL